MEEKNVTCKAAVDQIADYIAGNQKEITQFLADFIAIPSVTYQEGAAVSFLADKMREFGYDEVRVDPVGNVLGRVGSGPITLLYDAHIDTVAPGDESEWGGFAPFGGEVKDGVIHGRGAVDDKGCLAGIAYAGKAIKALGLDKGFTLWVSGSISEEDVEGSCVEAMLKEMPDIKPAYVLVAESSEGRIVRGHKGRALLRITVPGKAAHASAAWRGDNALVKALPIMQRIHEYQAFEEDEFLGKGTIEVTHVNPKTPSLNTIPGEAVITCDRRISRSESIEELLQEARQFFADIPGVKADIDTEEVTTYTGYNIKCVDYFPSWVMPEEHPFIQAGIRAYEDSFGEAPTVGRWDFSTNATSLCGRQGIPAMGFGPGDGALCHSYNDSLPVADLLKAIRFYAALPLYVSKIIK
ncbi:MAG: YgeY family selenium metabolism-linked hydrolase [Christensenellaceae bacterium]|nr:YgeY family selenium metabolism-linked hydrolase [Christensenellaceae bacterium]